MTAYLLGVATGAVVTLAIVLAADIARIMQETKR